MEFGKTEQKKGNRHMNPGLNDALRPVYTNAGFVRK